MSSRRRLKRKMDRQELIQKLKVKCPLCGKTAASSEDDAWEMARKQFARYGGEMPKRVYQCDERIPFFHWTRWEQPPAHLRVVRQVDTNPIYSEDYWK
jgi:hypothetical protein